MCSTRSLFSFFELIEKERLGWGGGFGVKVSGQKQTLGVLVASIPGYRRLECKISVGCILYGMMR